MRAFFARAAIALPLLLSFSACSESSGAAGPQAGAATESELNALCNAQCDRSTRCHPANGTGGQTGACPQDCKGDLGNLATRIRGDVVRSLTSCYATLACDVNDDSCTLGFLSPGESVDAALHAPDVSACLHKEKECHDTPGHFSDDVCGNLLALVATARAEAAQCFNMQCEAIPPCLQPVFGH